MGPQVQFLVANLIIVVTTGWQNVGAAGRALCLVCFQPVYTLFFN